MLRRAAILAAAWAAFLVSSTPAQPFRQDPFARYRAARDGTTIEEWQRRLDDDRADIRLEAVKSLGDSGDRKAVPALLQAVTDRDPRVAAMAVDALGKLRATEATDFLVERLVLKETTPRLRHHILGALAQIGDSSAIRPVLELVEREQDAEVRAAAIYALGEMGDATVADEVRGIADRESDPDLKKLASEASRKITLRSAPPAPSIPVPSGPLVSPPGAGE
jgi:HEAT repeat protein